MRIFLEACCTSIEDVLLAQKEGASRIELCEDLSCGGITPSMELLRRVKEVAAIPVNVLVRPVATEDFTVDTGQADLLLEQIAECKLAGADGIVAGALLPDRSIDLSLLNRIVAAASPLPISFHKAFDLCREPVLALEQLISAGCSRLLTSGCAPTALEGIPELQRLVSKADGRIIIMPGGHIRPSNIQEIIDKVNAPEYHASAAFFKKK